MKPIAFGNKARYPVQTTVNQKQYERIQRLRKECLTLISEILEAGCLVIEKKKGIKNDL